MIVGPSKVEILESIITTLQSISSSNEKKEFLKNLSEYDKSVIIKYFQYVYDEVNYTYGKSKLPIIARQEIIDIDDNLVDFYHILNDLNSGELKGKRADEEIQDYLCNKAPIYENLFFYVLKRDIKAKVGARLINSVIPGAIPIAPYQRCEQEKMMQKRIKYPAITQTKADGLFMNLHLSNSPDDIICTSRYGRNIPCNDFFKSFAQLGIHGKVLHGELLLLDKDGKIMLREAGNGAINKYILQESTLLNIDKKYSEAKTQKAKDKILTDKDIFIEECKYIERNIIFKVWDIVEKDKWLNLYSEVKYLDRFKETAELVKKMQKIVQHEKIQLIDFKIVHNEDEAMIFYAEQLDKKEEGMVIKNLHSHWEHDTNISGVIKLKDFKDCDLIITGWEYGEAGGDFETGIGSFICESSDGNLVVNVSGMSQKQRGFERVDLKDSSKGIKLIEDFDLNWATGKIIAVKFNTVIKSKNNMTWSLFLPSVLEVRESYDKSLAETTEAILKK